MPPQMASHKPGGSGPDGPPYRGGGPALLAGVASRIDRLNLWVGYGAAWLAVLMVMLQAGLVVGRYVFGVGSIPVQESVLYMHGLLFTLAAGYALVQDGHVRVDIIYRRLGTRGRAWVDLLGAVFFLLPFMVAIGWTSWPYVVESWRTLEGSRETSGLPVLFLLKSAIPAMALLVGLQGIAMAVRAGLTLLTYRAASAKDRADPAS